MSTFPAAARPCAACPWVKTNTADQIPGYGHELAENLAATCPDERGFGPEFGDPMFACHASDEGLEKACAGWLATVGVEHPRVRLALVFGELDEARLKPQPDWPPLHPNFASLITKLRENVQKNP